MFIFLKKMLSSNIVVLFIVLVNFTSAFEVVSIGVVTSTFTKDLDLI
jgi:hypothetical protein